MTCGRRVHKSVQTYRYVHARRQFVTYHVSRQNIAPNASHPSHLRVRFRRRRSSGVLLRSILAAAWTVHWRGSRRRRMMRLQKQRRDLLSTEQSLSKFRQVTSPVSAHLPRTSGEKLLRDPTHTMAVAPAKASLLLPRVAVSFRTLTLCPPVAPTTEGRGRSSPRTLWPEAPLRFMQGDNAATCCVLQHAACPATCTTLRCRPHL